MKKKTFILLAFFLATLSSCFVRDIVNKERDNIRKELEEKSKRRERYNAENRMTREEAKRRINMYSAISVNDADMVKAYLEESYDPNRCFGEFWSDNTPLHVLAKGFYDTWVEKVIIGEDVPDPPPDVEIFHMLVDAGADVNKWPYVWIRVYQADNRSIDIMLDNYTMWNTGKNMVTEDDKKEFIENEEVFINLMNDINRLIETYLKAGADPDMRGHPYPYTREAKSNYITDEEAEEYFAKGTRPINEAIKKGMRWESQVDLLLQYTTLDEDSLKAAEESKDKDMIKKIEKLWKEQNARKD